MPVYNAEPYLFEAIQSMLNQTYTDFELIILDDCS
ncbi:MAG: glycosyltransferase family A protein, partial [Paludibacter sp.]|nr:glycosyltransferase family A protein [Paludibacter sp.]